MLKHFGMFIFAIAVSLTFAGNAHALDYFTDNPPTDPCGEIDPNRACYAVTDPTACKQGVGYDACKTYCVCVYNANVKKCGTGITCKQIALAEKNACLSNCVADWSIVVQGSAFTHN